VAADLTNQAADAPHLPGQVAQTRQNAARWPRSWLADAGFFSETNVALLLEAGIEAFIPPDRIKHNEWYQELPPDGSPSDATTLAEQLRQKLRTPDGSKTYQKRQTSVEPVFGQLKEALGFRHFLLRSLDKTRSEWRFVCGTHNLWKLFRAGVNVQALRV